MALTPLESATITKSIQTCKQMIEPVKAALDVLDVLYNSVNGLSTTITQANLDATTSLSGLTKAQLDSALNALTNASTGIKGAIVNSYSALAELAERAGF